MQTYSQFAPTPYDRAGAFLPERADWLVAPVTRNRDSGPIDESNFQAALGILGGESDTLEIHRFGHWGPGWYEAILVHPSRAAEVEALGARLADYPLLDENDCSAREFDAYLEAWDGWGRRDFWKRVCAQVGELSCPEAADALEDADDDTIDGFAPRDDVNWLYQMDGDGVTINVGGLVECSDLEAIAAWAEAEGFALRRRTDIARYCRAFQLPEPVIRRAVALDLDTFSAIVAICDP